MKWMNEPELDWERQRAFLAVLREGSLSAASRSLGVAQPTVRRRLEALEETMGIALFTRSPQGLTPTELGRALGPHAEAMAAASDAFARASSARSRSVAGTVRITASEIVGTEVLPGTLVKLRREQPALRFELALTSRTEDLLRQEADIAVRMIRPDQSALVARRASAVALGFFASPAYVDRYGKPREMAELDRFSLIGPDRQIADLRFLRAAGLSPKSFAVRVDSHVAQLHAIRAGLGIGLCQSPLSRREPTLVPILPEALSTKLDMWVAMHEDLRKVPHVRVTFDHLVKELARYAAT